MPFLKVMKRILLLSDFLGYGKVACNAMIPILNYNDIETLCLPTSLVSNTLNYGQFNIYNTTSFIEDSLNTYNKLNIKYQCLYSGFLFDKKQFDIIKDIKKRDSDLLYVLDPIMADDHKLYNGVDDAKVDNYKELLKLADIIIPNYTESLLLCGYRANDDVGYDVIADKLKMLAKSFVITSYVENNEHFVIVYDHILDKLDKIAYKYLPYSLAGTGDIFASILISNYLNGYDLYTSSIKTIRSINILIKANMHLKQGKPLAIEQYLDKIF